MSAPTGRPSAAWPRRRRGAACGQCADLFVGVAVGSVAGWAGDFADGGYRFAAGEAGGGGAGDRRFAVAGAGLGRRAGYGGPHAPYVQTQRLEFYREALEKLKAAERVYPCTCTRSDVEAAASAPHVGRRGRVIRERVPPRGCGRAIVARSASEGSAGSNFVWRFRTSDQMREFDDLVAGRRTCNVADGSGRFCHRQSRWHAGVSARGRGR